MAKAPRTKTKKEPPKKGSSPGRLIFGAATFIAVIASAIAVLAYFHYQSWLARPVLSEGESVIINIQRGASWPAIVSELERGDLVDRPLYFDLWARRSGLPQRVKAGQIALDGPLSLEELAAALEKGGEADEVSLTIPEGFTIFHIADRLENLGLAKREAFLDAARDREALAAAGISGDSFEGYLFPDTYRFKKGTSVETIIQRMKSRFDEVFREVETAHATSHSALESQFAFDQASFVTMASLVERESGVGSERPLIARVFYNRLEKGMRLQTDPTCVYGEATYLDVPSPKTCKDRLNRYSTYVIPGLPPGPIANPGRESLEAALDPNDDDASKRYLFFVAKRDGSGAHHFSATYAEHKKAIKRFLTGGK